MVRRQSSTPVDKVCSIAFPFQKRGFTPVTTMRFPIYDVNLPASVAWDQLIPIITSTEMGFVDNLDVLLKCHDKWRLSHSPTIQLLRLFPHPSRHHWFPSWTQVLQYPDVSIRDNGPEVSVRDNDPDDAVIPPWYKRLYTWLGSYIWREKKRNPGPTPIMKDYSLNIVSGRIYRGCSLQLSQPPTPEKKAVYSCTMDNKDAQLVATVPGIELHIDSATKYVLVDISPDISLWPGTDSTSCQKTDAGHEHLPIWQESVVLVCEEVDTLPRPTKGSSTVMEYYLRRITTLEWDCRLSTNPDTTHWLPFEPSLVHMRSIVCSARGESFTNTLSPEPEVFCDPTAVAGLLSQDGWHDKWKEQWPVYEVYLV